MTAYSNEDMLFLLDFSEIKYTYRTAEGDMGK